MATVTNTIHGKAFTIYNDSGLTPQLVTTIPSPGPGYKLRIIGIVALQVGNAASATLTLSFLWAGGSFAAPWNAVIAVIRRAANQESNFQYSAGHPEGGLIGSEDQRFELTATGPADTSQTNIEITYTVEKCSAAQIPG